ncbi:hypothetical protein Q7P37_011172 [Cladosporium fusiforme]
MWVAGRSVLLRLMPGVCLPALPICAISEALSPHLLTASVLSSLPVSRPANLVVFLPHLKIAQRTRRKGLAQQALPAFTFFQSPSLAAILPQRLLLLPTRPASSRSTGLVRVFSPLVRPGSNHRLVYHQSITDNNIHHHPAEYPLFTTTGKLIAPPLRSALLTRRSLARPHTPPLPRQPLHASRNPVHTQSSTPALHRIHPGVTSSAFLCNLYRIALPSARSHLLPMGLDTRRPPLPAPTDISSLDDSEVATNLTSKTDKTSHTIPEDGSPITITTHRGPVSKKEGRHHSRQKSQTSLLIEYFEAGKGPDKSKSKPSVRVRVTPSSRKGSRGQDAVQITGIGKDRKPSYSRRISLSGKRPEDRAVEGTEVSHSSESNVSGQPPVEIEVLNDSSEVSRAEASRARPPSPLFYAPNESNVSSMPPDSMLEGSTADSELAREYGPEGSMTASEAEYLKAPSHTRSRSASQDRITQKVMEKLNQQQGKTRRSSRDYEAGHRRRRSSKSHRYEDTISGTESSLISSNPTASQRSQVSSISQGSRMTNNPKLLEMVEDTIKRMILPEIDAIRADQKVDRNHRTFDESRRGSMPQSDLDKSGVSRSLSKSSSTPQFANRPKVVLNREGDDPGTTLSRGDSEYKKSRKSSRDRPSTGRRSSSRRSVDSESFVEEGGKSKSGKSSHRARDAAAGALAGGILTKAALRNHDSQSDVHERRKKRTKSRGAHERSGSYTDTADEDSYLKEKSVPPMPMASRINDSDLTRDSIMSADSRDPGDSTLTEEVRTPVREVSRKSLEMSPSSSRTPTRTSMSRGIGMSHDNRNLDSPDSNSSTTKARIAALTAAGLGGAAAARGFGNSRNVDADGYGSKSSRPSLGSPAQSVSSLRKQFDEPLVPSPLRPQSAASRPSSVGRLRDSQESPTEMRAGALSPTGKQTGARKNVRAMSSSGDEFTTPMEKPNAAFMREGTSTPTGESVEEWYERQHLENDKYRESFGDDNRASLQTNPYPEDENRYSTYTQDSQMDDKRYSTYTQDSQDDPNRLSVGQDVRGVGANPQYVNHPAGLESAVASLVDPSSLSSNMLSSTANSSSRGNGTYSDRMAQHARNLSQDEPASYEAVTANQPAPSQNRWAALKGQAADKLASNGQEGLGSPRQSEGRGLNNDRPDSESPIKLGASGLPDANDPLPEIGHYDDTRSELSTNPSLIDGPLGGDAAGKETWPYTPSPSQEVNTEARRGSESGKGGHGKSAALLGAGLGAAGALAMAKGARGGQQPTAENDDYEDRKLTPDTRHYNEQRYDDDGKLTPDVGRYGGDIDRNATPTSPAMPRDEGYDTAHDRSAGALTPKAEQQQYNNADIDAFNRAMNGPDGGNDPFMSDPRHQRHVSGGSHGMASPLYDSSTGKGMDHIQSKDIVALMDHLTVRDAQRNARDTEILVSLVRSAAEMRQNFEEMKHFIKDQDRMIMANTDRDAEQTVQRVLGGPRPLPPSSPRTPRQSQTSSEDVQTKRKGVLSRALRGLKGNKNASAADLARIEDMLMQVLDNVEDLKHQGVIPSRQPMSSFTNETNESLDSYEKLRAAPDSGYEPEGNAGTGSTPSHSGHLSITRGDKNQFHSGYNGRPGSVNRVSTVMEGSEEGEDDRYDDRYDDDDSYLQPHERDVLDHQFENNEKMLTPTQETQRGFGTPPQRGTPGSQGNDLTPRTADKERKHKSNSSSIFAAIPKISRWSKTTSSSAAPDPASADSPNMARNQRPVSRDSQASSMRSYDSEDFIPHDDDQSSFVSSPRRGQNYNNAETRSMRSQASRLTRTPSPLIPSEASYNRDDDDYGYSQSRQQPQQQQYQRQQYSQHSPVQQVADFDEPEFDDPKYQAHRNSLLLQHPQPRQGPTSRHQNTLEDQAHAALVDDGMTSSTLSQQTVSDFDPANWGSAGAGALNRNRLPQTDPESPVSTKAKPDVPQSQPRKPQPVQQPQQQQAPSKTSWDRYEDDEDWEPQYSNSGFARNYNSHSGGGTGMYYSSPLGSGHLLEPIQEVRYSLETDSGHLTPEPSMTPKISSARAVDVRAARRGNSLTGPRPMGSKSPNPTQQAAGGNGTVRRKPVRGSKPSLESLESDKSSTFLH